MMSETVKIVAAFLPRCLALAKSAKASISTAGQLVQRFNVSNAKNASLDMSQLTNGTYVLKVISETATNSVKVIKK